MCKQPRHACLRCSCLKHACLDLLCKRALIDALPNKQQFINYMGKKIDDKIYLKKSQKKLAAFMYFRKCILSKIKIHIFPTDTVCLADYMYCGLIHVHRILDM